MSGTLAQPIPASASSGTADVVAGERFLAALAARDWEAIEGCLAPEVRFRALTPNHVWGMFGTTGAIATLRGWFDDAERIAFVASRVDLVGDRVALVYRYLKCDEDDATLYEHHAFCDVADGRIADFCMICSGPLQPSAADLAR